MVFEAQLNYMPEDVAFHSTHVHREEAVFHGSGEARRKLFCITLVVLQKIFEKYLLNQMTDNVSQEKYVGSGSIVSFTDNFLATIGFL